MSPDVLVARAMLLMPILLSLLILGAGLIVALRGLRLMRAEGSPPGWMWQSLIVVAGLEWITCAGMNVGEFLSLFSESWPGLIAFAGVYFGAWTTGQTIKAVKLGKSGGEVGQIGGAP